MEQHICPWWLAYTFDNPLRSLIHRPEKIFSGLVKTDMQVADIGCGMGHFSLGLARMVGDHGKVYAVDVQPQMLDRVAKRAAKAKLANRIETYQCPPDRIGLDNQLDFALAFYMVHETPDPLRFFHQVHALLKPNCALLLAEPKFHVSRNRFNQELADAQRAGFQITHQPTLALSHTAVLIAN